MAIIDVFILFETLTPYTSHCSITNKKMEQRLLKRLSTNLNIILFTNSILQTA